MRVQRDGLVVKPQCGVRVAGFEFAERKMPAQVAVKCCGFRIAGEPGGQERARGVRVSIFVIKVREGVCGPGVVRILFDRPFEHRAGGGAPAGFDQGHRVMRGEPPVVAVMRREAIHQGHQFVGPGGVPAEGDQSGEAAAHVGDHPVPRPAFQMRPACVQGGLGLSGDQQSEEREMTGFAGGQTGRHGVGRSQGGLRGGHIGGHEQGLCLGSMGQGKTWIGSDGPIECVDSTWIEGQQQIGSLDVSLPRRAGGGGQRKVVLVCQHDASRLLPISRIPVMPFARKSGRIRSLPSWAMPSK